MEIRAIRMLIQTLFERDSKHLNPNSNHLKRIRSIQIHILNIRKGLEAFECKFKPFEGDSKQSNANSNHSKGHSNASSKLSKGLWSFRMQILTIRKGFETFKSKFKPLQRYSKHSNANCNHLNENSNHSKGVWSIPMQIQTIRKAFETFESKFEPYKRDSRNSNPKSNHSKGIRSIRMQIIAIRKEFEAFESKFEPLDMAFECKFEAL